MNLSLSLLGHLLAMGFTGPRKAGLLEGFGVALTDRGNVATGAG